MSDPINGSSNRIFGSGWRELTANEVSGEGFQQFVNNVMSTREGLLKSLLDTRRDIDAECGFPKEIRVEEYKYLFDREPVAARAVELFPKESWQTTPRVYEDEDPEEQTEFEEAWDNLSKDLRGTSWYGDENGSPVWEALFRADVLSGIGHFGVLLLGLDDGKDLREPVELRTDKDKKTEGTKHRLLFLRSFDESLVQISRFESDPTSPRFGMPVSYLITFNDPSDGGTHSGIGISMITAEVHWTRLIHLADNCEQASSNEIFAPPRMRSVYNNLLGLRKLYSGSPEMYWKGAFPGYTLETNPQLGGDVNVDIEGTKNMMENWQNGLQRYLILMGMSLKGQSPQVVDCTAQVKVQIEAICIKKGCPVRVFMGSERGELASGQDDAAWNDRLRFRQNIYITPRIIVPFVDRLIQIGVLPVPEDGYHVMWPDLDSLSDQEQAQVGLVITQAMQAYIGGNVEALIAPIDWLTRVMGLDDEAAQAIIDNTQQHLEKSYPESPDEEYIPGHTPAEPEEEEPEEEEPEEEEEEPEESAGFGGRVENSEWEDVENCGGEGGKPGPCPSQGESSRQQQIIELRKTHAGVLATPLMSEGSISPMQVGMMSPGQKAKYQKDSQARMEIESQIKHLSKTDTELAGEASHQQSEEVRKRTLQIDSIVGTMQRMKDKNGKVLPKYQKEITKLLTERESLTRNEESVENCKGKGGKPGPCPDPTKAEPVKAEGKSVTGAGEVKEKGRGAPGASIMREATTKPPPGPSFKPDVDDVDEKTGVTKTSRVGVPGNAVLPPPDVPQLPNLTKHERAVETEFRDAFHKDPDGAASKFLDMVKKAGDPPTFGTDDAKAMHSAWSDPSMTLEQRSQNRATLNNVLHQTANAIAKRALLQHLDTLKPGDEMLVTVGGCGAGKGYCLGEKGPPEAQELKKRAKAVWDSAGDQNATENPWLQEEAEKRGLKVTYAHIDADPKTQWADPNMGVVKRAQNPKDGRMVDAQVFADSYAIGSKNHHEFHQKNKDNPNANFVFLKTGKEVKLVDGVSEAARNVDRHELAEFSLKTVADDPSIPPHIKRGATSGVRIWGPPKKSKVTNSEYDMTENREKWDEEATKAWDAVEQEQIHRQDGMARYAYDKEYVLKSKNMKGPDLNDDGSEVGSDWDSSTEKPTKNSEWGDVENCGGEGGTMGPCPMGGKTAEAVKKPREKLTPKQKKERSDKAFAEAQATRTPKDQETFAAARKDGVMIPPAWTEVTYFGKKADIQAKGRDAAGRLQPIERPGYRQGVSNENNKRIDKELTPKMDKIRSKLQKDAKAGNEEAKVLYLISKTGFRIGGEGDGKAKTKAYGAANLTGDHVKIEGDTVHFDFPGKKGVQQQHSITDATIADMVKDAKPGKPIFDTNDVKVRDTWQTTYKGTKVHDIRHVIATETARAEIAKLIPPLPKTKKEREKLIRVIGTAVGHKLGNNWKQAIDTYIDPPTIKQIKVAA